MGLSAGVLARALGVPPNRVTGILNGTRSITADTSLRRARFFDSSAEFWMNLQQAYDLRRARMESGRLIDKTVHPAAAV